jgi:hypothetical protein
MNMEKENNSILKYLFITLIVLLVFNLFNTDKYIGFYYPDRDNLSHDIQSTNSFQSIEECREWVYDQADLHNTLLGFYDYECGKNCDISGGKPYLCEETIK